MKETDGIISGNLEGSAWSQLGDEGLGSEGGGSGDDHWRSGGAPGLIREGFEGRGQSQWAWTEGRDDRWRLSGGWDGERRGSRARGWTVSGAMSGLCRGKGRLAGQLWVWDGLLEP